jgi:addiction module HigA family antidote
MGHSISVHPGKVLVDELEERGISQSALALNVGVLNKTINEICRGKRGISAEMAVKLSIALGASPQFWMNLQVNWELSQVRRGSLKKKIKPMAA